MSVALKENPPGLQLEESLVVQLEKMDPNSTENVTLEDSNNSISNSEIIYKPEKKDHDEECVDEKAHQDSATAFKSKKKDKRKEPREQDFINLLLVGKTGNGKSATGNSILNRTYFKSEPTCMSVTTKVSYEMVEFEKRYIKVVDGPGLGDTHHIDDVVKATELVMDSMKDAVLLNPDGYNAFLLVIKYAGRLTKEDKECIRILKAIFGPDFVKNYCILVVTNGDLFKVHKKETKKTFKNWCKEQEGIFKELLAECDNRVVLFDNISKEKVVRKKQMKTLIEIIDELQHRNRRYTDKHFQFANKNRQKIMSEIKEPLVRQNALEKISIIFQKLDKINQTDISDQSDKLKTLLDESDNLSKHVKEMDNESGLLTDLFMTIDGISKRLEEKMEYNERMCKLEEELQNNYLEKLRKHEDEFRFQIEKKNMENKEIVESISASKRQMEEDFETKQKQLQIDTENKRFSAQKIIDEKERELEKLLSSKVNDEKTIKYVHEEKKNLEAKLESMLHDIQERENKMKVKIENEKLNATKVIQQEQLKYHKKIAEFEKEKEKLKLEHDKQIENMKMMFSLSNELSEKTQKHFQEQSIQSGIELKDVKTKYDKLKVKYDEDLRRACARSDSFCRQQ